MSTAAQVLAVVVGIMLVSVWVMEAFLYHHPRLYPLFLVKPDEVAAVRMWTVNLGFYNLTTAAAMFIGVALDNADRVAHGEALIVFTAAQHVFLAGVLLVTRPKLWFNAVLEALPNAALLALTLA